MAHIVIIGAGTGGMPCAYEMRDELDKEHQITMITENETFDFTPSNPWIAVGWRQRKDISFEIKPYLEKRNINFIASRVEKISASENQLTLLNGETVNYDYLVITTGPKLAFEEVEGAGPAIGHTQSICTLNHAEQAFTDFEKLVAEPGPVIIGAMPFASCFGPAYEYAFILNRELQQRKIRDKIPMLLVTSEPYIGHLGLAGVGDSKGMLESEMRQHHIQWICNAKTTKIEAGKMYVDELNEDGGLKKQHQLPFKHAMMLPAFKGVDAVAAVEGLCNPRGFVLIDKHQRSPKYPNIFSAGVCVAIPPVEATPVPTGAPKTGYMIESMITAIVHNIGRLVNGQEADQEGTWNAICLADMGNTGAAFVAIPQIPPRNLAWFKKGKWVHLAKIGFEKYFIRKMKSGSSEPIYEKYVLKALGINRLK
jgi:sulfide:quinone oxidoreductase